MSIVLMGSTSGSVTLQEPAIAGTTTINLPASSGTAVVGSLAVSAAGQIPFSTDGSTYTPTAKIVSGTAVASTSGTSIDFTSIPSWVKRVTVMFNNVSTSGSSYKLVQIGSGSVTTTGYVSAGGGIAGNVGFGSLSSTAGFIIISSESADNLYGSVVINLVTGNTYGAYGSLGDTAGTYVNTYTVSGGITLGGLLDRIRITTVNGTDTFTAGTINILYE
jgi:hypothetical protein